MIRLHPAAGKRPPFFVSLNTSWQWMRRCCWLIGWCFFSMGVSSSAIADAVSADVKRDGKRFVIDFQVDVAAPPARVFALLTDYQNLADISPSTVFSDWVKPNILRVEIKACVMVFCKTMTKLTQIEEELDHSVIYSGVQEAAEFRSSFAYSRETLKIAATQERGGSVVSYNAELEPAFHVPALIRGWMVRYVLIKDLKATLLNVEAVVATERQDVAVSGK